MAGGFTLDQVVPWGRTFDEYRRMFALTETALARRIVGVGDGPSSFNAEATARGHRVVSIDPIYAFGREELARRFAVVREEVLRQTERNREEFVWEEISSVAVLAERRSGAMARFLADFEEGMSRGRYVIGALPDLPLGDERMISPSSRI